MVEYLTYSGAFGIEVDCEEDCYAKDTSKKVDEKWQYSTEVIARNEDFARRLKEQCEDLGVTLGIPLLRTPHQQKLVTIINLGENIVTTQSSRRIAHLASGVQITGRRVITIWSVRVLKI